MSNTIHPTAILEGDIRLGHGNVICPYVVIRGSVTIGDNNIIDTGVNIENRVVVGNGNHVYAYASIGALGEMGAKGDRLVPDGAVVIGNDVTIREFVCIHSPVYSPETRIDDQVYLMNKSYIAHDCLIGKGSVLSAAVSLGGRAVVDERVTLGMGATVHQRCHIGSGAMIGMQTPVTKHVLPFTKVAGNPSRIIGFNRKGAEAFGIDAIWWEEMELHFAKDVSMQLESHNPMIIMLNTFLSSNPESLTKVKNA
jgi:UDP-N-acetylglucosamine acyltransferase